MDVFTNMSALQAASLYISLMLAVLLGLKLYVGGRRGALKVPSGDVSNPDFARAQRVQQNAVEDVPVLLIALLSLGLLSAPLWLIHASGATLLASRLAHAFGLASSSGFSLGRMFGTFGTLIVYLTLVIALLLCAFDAASGSQ